MLDAEAAVETDACVSDRSFHYGDVDAALAGADLVVSERFRFPRWSCTPVECYGVVADWNAAEGSLTAWANFQGPFTLHSVAAAALGLPGSKLRLITPPDSGGSFGIKSAVFAYVVLMGLASRKLGVPVRWIEDRLEHLAASSSSSGRVTHVEAGLHRRRRARRAPLRRDRGRRRVRARARAGDALPHARLALGRVPRAERRGAEPRRPHEHDAERAQPRLRRPAALPRARADDDDRGGPARARPGRAAAAQPRSGADEFPYRTPSGALYDSGDYEGCLDDALDARALRRAARGGRGARAEGRLVGVGIACVVEPSISNMGYITLAEPADTRGLPKSGNAEGCTIAISALGGITVRTATTPQGQGHRTVIAQVVADALGVEPKDVDVAHRGRHVDLAVDDRVRELLVALLGRRRRRRRGRGRAARGEDRRDPRAPRRRERVAPPDRRHRALEPGVAAARDGAGARGDRLLRGAEPPPAGRRRPRRLLRGARLRRRRRRGRGRSRDRRGHGPRLRHRARRRAAAQPAARRGPGARRPRARSRRPRSSSASSTTRTETS